MASLRSIPAKAAIRKGTIPEPGPPKDRAAAGAFAQHPGALVITLRRPNRDQLLRRWFDALAALGARTLDNAVWLVTDTRIYSRRKR